MCAEKWILKPIWKIKILSIGKSNLKNNNARGLQHPISKLNYDFLFTHKRLKKANDKEKILAKYLSSKELISRICKERP